MNSAKDYFEQFRDAQKERNLFQDFELLGIKVRLCNMDLTAIARKIRDMKVERTDKYLAGVYKDKPVDEKKWNKYLKDRKKALIEVNTDEKTGKVDHETVDQLMKDEIENKPDNEAERVANTEVTSDAMFEIIPTFLTDPDSGERMFQEGSEGLVKFNEMVKGDLSMIGAISENYVILQNRTIELKETVKNLSGEENSTSTLSETKSGNDTDNSLSVTE